MTAEEVVAFGDMPNDLAMLRLGRHVVRVANAHPDVLDLADRTAPSHEDDGVAAVLEELFGL